jgi:putative tryptophan/tyrosine transport system substrate-binding protein
LQELGWTVGRNVQLDWRWYTVDAQRLRKDAEELVALAPDVIVALGGLMLTPLRQTGSTVPIVFTATTLRGLRRSITVSRRNGCNC